MDFIKNINLNGNLEDSKLKVLQGLKIAIEKDLLVVFKGALSRFNKNWFFKIFEESKLVKIETTQIDVNKLSKYSQKWWKIEYDPLNETVYKHSKTSQPLHTDNAFLKNPPSISLFAMEKQVNKGGETTLLPLTKLVSLLEEKDPKLLEELSENLFEIVKGNEVEGNLCPIIDLKKMVINWNYYRTKKNSIQHANTIQRFFNFLNSLEKDNLIYVIKFYTYDVYIFNDLKFLHARKSFEAKKKGDRLLSHSIWHII